MALASNTVWVPELHAPEVERIGHAGGDREAELVQVEPLAGDRGGAADVGEEVRPRLSGARLGSAEIERATAASTPCRRPSEMA